MTTSLGAHRNILTELIGELDTKAADAKRRADIAGDELPALLHGDKRDEVLVTLARERGLQDAYTEVAGRLRNIAGARIARLVDSTVLDELLGDVFIGIGLDTFDGVPEAKVDRLRRHVRQAILGDLRINGERVLDPHDRITLTPAELVAEHTGNNDLEDGPR